MTAWEMMPRMKRMPMTDEVPPHPLFLCPLLLHLRRSTMKAVWRWFLSRKLMWRTKSYWQMLSLRYDSPISTTHS
jgi:hypothetical protein